MNEALALPGPRLKAEREKRGYSAEKVANDLHLDPWVVDALEAADYPRVGPAVFVKGHLKRYAELLGLPPAEIVAGFDAGGGAPPSIAPPRLAPAFGALVPARDDGATLKKWAPLAIVGVLLVVLLAAGVLWWQPWKPHTTARAAANAAATPAPALPDGGDGRPAAAGAVHSAGEIPPVSAATAAMPTGDLAPGPVGAHVRLKLSFVASSWVDVRDAEGKRAFSGPGEANSVKIVAATGPLHVFLGSANDVQIEINDHAVAIGPQFYSGRTARFEADADGTLRPDAGPPPVPARVRGASKGTTNGPSHAARPPG